MHSHSNHLYMEGELGRT